jgi:hypothetical protein
LIHRLPARIADQTYLPQLLGRHRLYDDVAVIPNGSRGNGRSAEAAAYLCKKHYGDTARGSAGTLTRIASPRYSRGQAAGEADALSVLPYAGGTASPTSSLAPSVASVGYEGRGAVTERVVINIRVTAWSG